MIRHARGDPGQKALMMDAVKKFGQIQINHRPITSFQVACCFRNGGVSAAMRAEPVAAGVKVRLEDRLQSLEYRLLNHPIHHVGNTEPPLPASGLRQPHPANVAGPVASRQHVTVQPGDQRRGLRFRLLDRLSVHSRCSLVAHHVE